MKYEIIETPKTRCVVITKEKSKTVASIPKSTSTLILDQTDEWNETNTVEISIGELLRILTDLNPIVD